MNFGEVLTKAGRIIWKHKVLWITPILLSLVNTFFSICNIIYSGFSQSTMLRNNSSLILGLTGLFCIIDLAYLVIGIYLGFANIVIVSRGTCQADQGIESLSFRELFRSVKTYFWRLVGLTLEIGLASMVVILPLACCAIMIAIITSMDLAKAMSYLWLIYPLSILLGIFLGGFRVHPIQALVQEELDISKSFSRGWQIYTRFFGTNIIMGLIMTVGTGIGYITILPQNYIGSRLVEIFTGGQPDMLSTILSLGTTFLYLLVAGFVMGIIGTYSQSVWALTFLRLTRPPVAPVEPIPAPVENA